MRMYAVEFFREGVKVWREIVTACSEREAEREAYRRGMVPWDVDSASVSVL